MMPDDDIDQTLMKFVKHCLEKLFQNFIQFSATFQM